MTRWHFAPTAASAANLLAEKFSADDILVTGNTVVDAVHMTRARLQDPAVRTGLETKLAEMGVNAEALANCVLVTAHRRENFNGGIADICHAVRRLSLTYPSVHFLWPVHKNPNVLDVVNRELSDLGNVHRLPPLDYPTLMLLMESARFVLTDSGGLQEESPSFRKPVLVLRDLTERPEVIECGAGKIVGTHVETIVRECERLLNDEASYQAMANAPNPFGDGRACERILERIKRDLLQTPPAHGDLRRDA